ncbi:MAG: F0F1 ATP synthase subunit A [Candidatus Eisenbacteria bacterium]|uniref:ATP synthase subunit a n=1 Tax=Eiseniibacteriota bacterium TaxID=2212470 RepID=A0A538TZX3_UNCEI|nr:MAG: F0F1 ATP synthase subunit A [Candidatus Eisenbacteria bacterium]
MGLELLARVRRTSLWVGGIAALIIATYAAPRAGLSVFAGTAWSLVNLILLERLIVALTGLDRRTFPATGRAIAAIGGLLLLFVAGWLLLQRLPATLLMAGFGIPFAVIVLKAIALLVLPSRAWRRFTRTPWPAVAVVVILAAGAWAVSNGWSGARSGPATGPVAARQAPGGSEAPVASEPAAGEHGGAVAHGGEEEKGPEKFANVLTVLARAFPDAGWARWLHHYEVIIFSLFIALMLCVIAMLATRNPQMVPGPLQNGVELVVQTLHDFLVDILGNKYGPRYVPFLGTLFVYILAMNLFGLIPFMDSPTSSLNVTVALALVVFIYSQYIGFRELGLVGWVDHMAGNPRSAIGWALVPLMLPIHLMGELAKPISLACRLFGNIFGEDMLLVAFASLGITVMGFTHLPLGLPLQLPFLFLALLTSTLQALVFTVLSTIYFLLMLPHDDHGDEAEGHTQSQHAH